MAFVKALWCKFIKLRFQLWSLRCLLCYLWKIQNKREHVQCSMSKAVQWSWNRENQRTTRLFVNRSRNRISKSKAEQMFSSEIAEPSDHHRVCITRCWCNMDQLKNELQRELLGEMTLEASDRVGNQFSVQRTPVGSRCTRHTAQCTVHSALPKLLQWWWWRRWTSSPRRTTSQTCTTSLK